MKNQKTALLQNMPIFYGIKVEAIDFILAGTKTVTVQPDNYFFYQGDEAHYMYVLESGQVSVHKTWLDRDLIIGTMGAGDCFGEVALIDSSARSASVRADTICSAIEISPLNLQALKDHDMEQYIEIQSNISRELCRRLRLADENRMLMVKPRVKIDDNDLCWPILS
jgi:CRP/FNR family transcriptional regulator, cyclic AMP receptor protein